jgi:DNA modification methylase
MAERQEALGDALFGTPMEQASQRPAVTADLATPDLDEIQADSEKQALPDQEKLFRVAKRVRSKLHSLPDPARPPLGFVPGRGFDVVFPFIKLPHLAPNLNGDWVQFGSPDLEPNRLYYGDNLQVLRTLPSNSIDLIYIDPPFFSGAEYNVIWGDTNEVRTFSDIWEGGLDTYLIWLNARLWEMRRVLRGTGSIYVHCDWHASHYIKGEMDKVFGYECFRNEVVWKRTTSPKNDSGFFGRIHDCLLFYVKSKGYKWNRQFLPLNADYVQKTFRYEDSKGRYRLNELTANKPGGDVEYEWNGVRPPRGRYWAYSRANMQKFADAGLIAYSKTGFPRLKKYLDDSSGVPLQTIWTDVPLEMSERIGYPTQKPAAVLNRIVRTSSDPGDVVADFFCGGGTTPAVAQELGRRWIACDSSRIAVSVTLDRLVKVGEEESGVMSNYGSTGACSNKIGHARDESPGCRHPRELCWRVPNGPFQSRRPTHV